MRPHAQYCCYRQTAGDPEPNRCNCKCTFNGMPFSHWQDMAKRLVVECLVRASAGLGLGQNVEYIALPAQLAAQRLMMLATLENSDMAEQVLKERDAFVENLHTILSPTVSNKKQDRQAAAKRRALKRTEKVKP